MSRILMVVPPLRSALLCVLCALFVGESPDARAGLITSFQTAFQPTTPAPGWAYLWNNAGLIGNPANYTPLLATTAGLYTDGGVDPPAAPPGNFVAFGISDALPGGHPGMGAAQEGSGGIERYAIAVYTLSSSDQIALLNGSLKNSNPNNGGSTDGLSLKVFVNDNPAPLLASGTAAGFDSIATFSLGLGKLNAGDKIYVAVGSNNADQFDSFQLSYDIASVPEPSATVLAVFGLSIFAALVTRCRRVPANSQLESKSGPMGWALKAHTP